MNKKVIFPVMLVCLLALSLAFVGCDNGSTDSEPVKTFTLTGISNIQKENEVGQGGQLLYGIFPAGTSEAIVESDSKKYFGLENGPPEAVVAYVGGPYATILANGSSGNWTISSTLQTVSGSVWAGYGIFDAYFVLVNSSNMVTVYRLKNLDVPQGQTTPISRPASAFTKLQP
ncbi:MAG: hypothetical protein LBQ46_00350 [Treponema sp.]|jgi:hypothetical protein|nr:hypothetical protein [Treponema sp.]